MNWPHNKKEGILLGHLRIKWLSVFDVTKMDKGFACFSKTEAELI